MKNYLPKGITRYAYRTGLKLNKKAPTIMVVAGVVGLGATAVMAAKATRNLDPVLDTHKQARSEIGYIGERESQKKELVQLYSRTAFDLTKLYGPTLFVGTVSAGSILYGHKILHGRHLASLAAYSGLAEQFQSYRNRVAATLGEEAEQDIRSGARGEWLEDPEHKGEYKLGPKWDQDDPQGFARPWFDETCYNWTKDPKANLMFLKGVQSHMNNQLQLKGHLFVNDVLEALRMPATQEGQICGWVYTDDSSVGDNFVDLGFLLSKDPNTIAFANGVETCVRLNLNHSGPVWNLI